MSLRFALAGNPNAGKTTLFNQLTGSNAHVGNWPGVTVERREGHYRKGDVSIDIIDLPGIYSLSPYTPEEIVARQYILDEHPDVIINIVDATNLERNLYLTTQIMETGSPVVIALNMMDAVEKQGKRIDHAKLEKALGCPVMPISAAKGRGIDALMERAIKAAKEPYTAVSPLMHGPLKEIFSSVFDHLEQDKVDHPIYHTVKLIEGDIEALHAIGIDTADFEHQELHKNAESMVRHKDIVTAVADLRYQYVSECLRGVVISAEEPGALTLSDRIDRLLTHQFWGLLIFLGIMFLVFHLTFSEDLFFLKGIMGWEEGIPGPGRFLESAFGDLIDQGIGLIAGALASAPGWVTGLIVDGALAGVGAILGFLPLVLMLYLFISILEDSGYMARAAYLMDHLMRKIGLSGRAFVPLLMGFGCSVPAFAATRTLENPRDRRITLMLVPFMSCGAKLPLYTLIGAAVFPQSADFVIYGMYILGILVGIISSLILSKIAFKGEETHFVMEMPAYHAPSVKSLFIHLWEKAKGFLIKAGTVILASSVVIWFFSNFSISLQMVEANSADSIMGLIGGALKTIFLPLGFAGGADGWKPAVAILAGLVAKEAVASTLGQLYNEGVADGAQAAVMVGLATAFSPLAALSFAAFNLLTVPCMAAVGALRAESKSRAEFWITIATWFATAWIISFLIYNVGGLVFPSLK